MTFILDLIDIKWFLDNFGDVLIGIIDSVSALLKSMMNYETAADEEAQQLKQQVNADE